MWVRFLRDYKFRPAAKPRSLRAFKSGMIQNVTRECATSAIAINAAVPADPPPGRQTVKGGFRRGRR
jgi:hypothetical protein